MRWLILGVLALTAVVAADHRFEDVDLHEFYVDKGKLIEGNVIVRQKIIWKLLNHMTERTLYKDIEDLGRDYVLEANVDKYLKTDVVKDFLRMYKSGTLPRGEIFCRRCNKQVHEAIRVFHLLYFAKDFDTFARTACWLKYRVNEMVFVYALTVAVLHREDCRGIVLPAPYEIYPHYFVDSDVIQKAQMLKMKNGALDLKLMEYYGIRTDGKGVFVIDNYDKPRRVQMSTEDRLTYFTEDVDLNTYYYYFHMDYPLWMGDDIFGVNKDRHGELYYYIHQQLLARHKLERLSHKMCDIKMLSLYKKVKNGVWPNLRHHNGWDIPVRYNDHKIINNENIHVVRLIEDLERRTREAIFKGYIETHDGTRFDIRKPEDIEYLGRLIHGNLAKTEVRFYKSLPSLLTVILGVDYHSNERSRVVTTLLDHYSTCLRDPVFWQLQKRIIDNFIVFKKMLPAYTRDDLEFPGVKIEKVTTDRLVTYFDTYNVDITNAVGLNDEEITKQKSNLVILARKLRLNHKPFVVNCEVNSEKAVDAVVRIFLGPKEDCLGNKLDINNKRLDFVEIDTFLYKLDTGKNVIRRNSYDMHNIIKERTLTRKLWDKTVTDADNLYDAMNINKVRIGFPDHLLLPIGRRGGMVMTLYVVITPVHTGRTLEEVNIDSMKHKKLCRSSVCFDTMPLGFPLDRHINKEYFYTENMKFIDVVIHHIGNDKMNTNLTNKDLNKTFMDTSLEVDSTKTNLPGVRDVSIERDSLERETYDSRYNF